MIFLQITAGSSQVNLKFNLIPSDSLSLASQTKSIGASPEFVCTVYDFLSSEQVILKHSPKTSLESVYLKLF